MKNSLPLTLPAGTQIVTRQEVHDENGQARCLAGMLGVIISAPSGQHNPYRVRFPDGSEILLERSQFTVRKHFQQDGIDQGQNEIARQM